MKNNEVVISEVLSGIWAYTATADATSEKVMFDRFRVTYVDSISNKLYSGDRIIKFNMDGEPKKITSEHHTQKLHSWHVRNKVDYKLKSLIGQCLEIGPDVDGKVLQSPSWYSITKIREYGRRGLHTKKN